MTTVHTEEKKAGRDRAVISDFINTGEYRCAKEEGVCGSCTEEERLHYINEHADELKLCTPVRKVKDFAEARELHTWCTLVTHSFHCCVCSRIGDTHLTCCNRTIAICKECAEQNMECPACRDEATYRIQIHNDLGVSVPQALLSAAYEEQPYDQEPFPEQIEDEYYPTLHKPVKHTEVVQEDDVKSNLLDDDMEPVSLPQHEPDDEETDESQMIAWRKRKRLAPDTLIMRNGPDIPMKDGASLAVVLANSNHPVNFTTETFSQSGIDKLRMKKFNFIDRYTPPRQDDEYEVQEWITYYYEKARHPSDPSQSLYEYVSKHSNDVSHTERIRGVINQAWHAFKRVPAVPDKKSAPVAYNILQNLMRTICRNAKQRSIANKQDCIKTEVEDIGSPAKKQKCADVNPSDEMKAREMASSYITEYIQAMNEQKSSHDKAMQIAQEKEIEKIRILYTYKSHSPPLQDISSQTKEEKFKVWNIYPSKMEGQSDEDIQEFYNESVRTVEIKISELMGVDLARCIKLKWNGELSASTYIVRRYMAESDSIEHTDAVNAVQKLNTLVHHDNTNDLTIYTVQGMMLRRICTTYYERMKDGTGTGTLKQYIQQQCSGMEDWMRILKFSTLVSKSEHCMLDRIDRPWAWVQYGMLKNRLQNALQLFKREKPNEFERIYTFGIN